MRCDAMRHYWTSNHPAFYRVLRTDTKKLCTDPSFSFLGVDVLGRTYRGEIVVCDGVAFLTKSESFSQLP